MGEGVDGGLESLIDQWRTFVSEHAQADVESTSQIERRIRDQSVELAASGLAEDEAFLIAVSRVSESDAMTREFARSFAATLLSSSDSLAHVEDERRSESRRFWVMLGFAAAAAVAIKLPELLGYDFAGADSSFYLRNLSFFVLPFLAAYFGFTRSVRARAASSVAVIFAAAAVFANAYPFVPEGSTELLTAIHLPILLWLVVGVIFAGGDWRSDAQRMRFTRFTGEWFVNYVLIALGGGVLTAITIGVFEAIGIDAEPIMQDWVLPCGAMGAVLVAAWLVETRRNLAGGMAPMLARVFTPLFAVMLVALLVGVIWAKGSIDAEREVLILFDLLLVVVLALLLYGISARDSGTPPGLFDRIQLLLVVCALAVDVFAIASIGARLGEYGFSANRTAALGLNLILLVNLTWSAVLQAGVVRSRRTFAEVERWQMRYLPVYAAWCAIVVVVFPPLFGFA